MGNFKFKSRSEILAFLAGINESAEIIMNTESPQDAILASVRTGPHLSSHLTDLVEQELTEAGYGKDEWSVTDISRHQIRCVISGAFCRAPLKIAGFEQLMNDLIYRYEGGDYSFTPEEARMNKYAEEARKKHMANNTPTSEVPDLIKKLMELVNEMIGDAGEVRVLDEEEAMRLLKSRLENKEEEDKDGTI